MSQYPQPIQTVPLVGNAGVKKTPPPKFKHHEKQAHEFLDFENLFSAPNSRLNRVSWWGLDFAGDTIIDLPSGGRLVNAPSFFEVLNTHQPDDRLGALIAQAAIMVDNVPQSSQGYVHRSLETAAADMIRTHSLKRLTKEEKHTLVEAFTDLVFNHMGKNRYHACLVLVDTFGGSQTGLARKIDSHDILGSVGKTVDILAGGFNTLINYDTGSFRWRRDEAYSDALEFMAKHGVAEHKLRNARAAPMFLKALHVESLMSHKTRVLEMLDKLSVFTGADLDFEVYGPSFRVNQAFGMGLDPLLDAITYIKQVRHNHRYYNRSSAVQVLGLPLQALNSIATAGEAAAELRKLTSDEWALFEAETTQSLSRKLKART